jgi:hypothetical protein
MNAAPRMLLKITRAASEIDPGFRGEVVAVI